MVAERVQRADEVISIDAEIEREVVAGAGGDTDERKPVGPCGGGHDGERPVAAGHAERIRPVRHGSIDEGCQVLVWLEDAGGDAALTRLIDQPYLRCLAAS